MRSEKLFCMQVPDDLLEELVRPLGLENLTDTRWISRDIYSDHLRQELESKLPLVEPYYRPCAKFYLEREMNMINYMRILRQICNTKGYKIESKEAGRKKVTKWRLITQKPRSFTVRFE